MNNSNPFFPIMRYLILLVVLAIPAFVRAQSTTPVTVAVAPKTIVAHFVGRTSSVVTKTWPATLKVWFSAEVNAETLSFTLQDPQGKPLKWPWKEAPAIKMPTGSVRCWTLSSVDTTGLPSGSYTLTLKARTTKRATSATYVFTVEETPAKIDAAEQSSNEIAYYRAIGDHAAAVAAAEKAFKLAPDDSAKAVTYGRTLLEAGRAQEALDVADNALDKVRPNKHEPPVALLRLSQEAEARIAPAK
jgi:hypothetical protein